ncbi:MAG: chromosomal replication initiator protein DnaA [Candidatus Levybacteria bacterium]|nr:chromosomal replication initiator protein DnaA [Candidatus Levybacteria bacterium]
MRTDVDELWKTALGEVETEVSKAHFLTFFKKTALVSLENNVATIAAHSSIGIDLLKKRFSDVIKKILKKHTGKDYLLVFIAKTLPEKNIEKKEEPLFSDSLISKDSLLKTPFSKSLSRVRPEFRFQTMAVSSSNQLAFVSAQTVAKNIGRSYNPLFIYGPTGVGKTHLMQAIANEVYEKYPDKKIIYITSEEFTNDVVGAIRSNDTARMKRRFRTVDLLIIDDVQFIAGKDKIQEELFHTFNILIDNASQVVLSSDRPPNEIKKLERRLSSRFSSGLTVDIEPPDFELRTAILLIKAVKYEIELPIDVARLIAQNSLDTRSLEGALLRVITEAKTKSEEITEQFAAKILKHQRGSTEEHRHPDDIINKVCSYYNIKSTQIKGPKRDSRLVKARHIAMFLLKKELGLPLVEIGNVLGGRDHTTIMHGVEKIDKLLSLPNTKNNNLSLEIMGITNITL